MKQDKKRPEWWFGIRLTPEPEDGRRGVFRTDQRVGPSVHKGWRRELKREVFRVMENYVTVPNQFCMKTHQAGIDVKPPKISDPGVRDGEQHIRLPNDKSSVLVDQQGHVVAWVFPHFLGNQLEYHNTVCEANAKSEFQDSGSADGTIPGSKSNGKARGGASTYTTTGGFRGTQTYVVAWHERPCKETKSFAPLHDTIICRTIQQAMERDQFVCSFAEFYWRVNTILEMVHPEFHHMLSTLRTELRVHATCRKILSIWESIFPGHSFICNRTTGCHIDYNSVRRGFEAILAGGNFTSGGSIYLKDIHVSLPLLPGTLVLLDGTALRPEIEPWTGEQRFSHAFFVHRSVLTELSIPTNMPDVTIQSVRDRLATAANTSNSQRPLKRSANDAGLL